MPPKKSGSRVIQRILKRKPARSQPPKKAKPKTVSTAPASNKDAAIELRCKDNSGKLQWRCVHFDAKGQCPKRGQTTYRKQRVCKLHRLIRGKPARASCGSLTRQLSSTGQSSHPSCEFRLPDASSCLKCVKKGTRYCQEHAKIKENKPCRATAGFHRRRKKQNILCAATTNNVPCPLRGTYRGPDQHLYCASHRPCCYQPADGVLCQETADFRGHANTFFCADHRPLIPNLARCELAAHADKSIDVAALGTVGA